MLQPDVARRRLKLRTITRPRPRSHIALEIEVGVVPSSLVQLLMHKNKISAVPKRQ